jgi:hypothetical protein
VVIILLVSLDQNILQVPPVIMVAPTSLALTPDLESARIITANLTQQQGRVLSQVKNPVSLEAEMSLVLQDITLA